MEIGKLCVVTDIGWFSELPDDAVIKIPFDISVNYIIELLNKIESDLNYYNTVTDIAKRYVYEQCNIKDITEKIHKFLFKASI